MIAIKGPYASRVAAGLGVVILLAAVYWIYRLSGSDEIRNKPEWSALQWAELNNREANVSRAPLILTVGNDKKYQVAGLRTKGKDRLTWVLLNPEYPPYYKQMPDSETLEITRDELSKVISQGRPHPEVAARLTQLMAEAPKKHD
jgi:hypothetical protein